MAKLWGGRFSGKTDPVMDAFNASIGFDRKLFEADIRGSQAYARATERQGILTPEESKAIQQGLDQIADEWRSGTFQLQPSDEDIHTANERRLGELIGAAAGKLHTGRSRNDQVATDMRLWLRDTLEAILARLHQLLGVVTARAAADIDILMPGYTHLQRAQPIRWSHWMLMYGWMWHADAERLAQLLRRMNSLPLGNPFGLDRHALAKDLGFASVMPNSMYGVSDRDFVAEFLFWSTLTMGHISRFAEDLVIYSTAEFGFVALADAYSTGSSLMPQKKNPDSLELLRGKSGRVFGQMSGFLMTLKGLSSTYNKDLQEDKEPMFDAAHTVLSSLQIAAGVLATLQVRPERMRQALSYDMLATDLAEYLVRKQSKGPTVSPQVPFREAHHVTGAAVRLAEQTPCGLHQLTLAQLQGLHPAFAADVTALWDFEASVERRDAYGGTSRRAVLEQIRTLQTAINVAAATSPEPGPHVAD